MKSWRMTIILFGLVVAAVSSVSGYGYCPCYVDPCDVSTCPNFPYAVCSSFYECYPIACLARYFVWNPVGYYWAEVTDLCFAGLQG